MAVIGNLVIGMSVNTKDFKAGLDRSSKQIETFQKDVGHFDVDLASILKSAAIVAAAAAAGVAVIAAGIYKAASAGSDLNEQLSKSKAVFGSSSSVIEKGAKEMADSFGVSKAEFIEGAAGVGVLGKASGLAQGEAAALGTQFAKLAADASSFHNVPMEDALLRLKSGLVGEAEPMRKFGVLLNVAAVEAEAANLKLKKVNGELTEGQKVQARSSLILKGMADAIGDLERTQNGFANTTRAMAGRLENLWADIGLAIQPATDAIVIFLNSGLKQLSEELGRNEQAIKKWATGAAADGGLVFRSFESIAKAIGVIADSIVGLRTVFRVLNVAMKDVIADFYEAAYAAGEWIRKTIPIHGPKVKAEAAFEKKRAEDARAAAHAAGAALAPQLMFPAPLPSVAIGKAFDAIRAKAVQAMQAVAGMAGAPANAANIMAGAAAAAQKAMDRLKSSAKTMADAGRQTFEATRTPLEQYLARMRELDEQFKAGVVDANTYFRATHDAEKELNEKSPGASYVHEYEGKIKTLQKRLAAGKIDQKTFNKSERFYRRERDDKLGRIPVQHAGALERGSKEAYSAVLNYRAPNTSADPERAVLNVGNKQLDVQRQMVALLTKMAGGNQAAGEALGAAMFNF